MQAQQTEPIPINYLGMEPTQVLDTWVQISGNGKSWEIGDIIWIWIGLNGLDWIGRIVSDGLDGLDWIGNRKVVH